MTSAEPYNLQRFIDAQRSVYEQVRREIKQGSKVTHWMWFIFPQLRGLGFSPTSQHFAMGSLLEAQAYWAHPVLGPRLLECTDLVNDVTGRSVAQIFGHPDDMKFHSCMTLFARVAGESSVFSDALRKYFAGQQDTRTLELLAHASDTSPSPS